MSWKYHERPDGTTGPRPWLSFVLIHMRRVRLWLWWRGLWGGAL